MSTRLFIVTGTSGTGKSAVIPKLKERLGERYRVYDFDEIWKPFDFTETWEGEVLKRAFKVARENAEAGFTTVVLGLIRPQKVKRLAQEVGFAGSIEFMLLNVSAEKRAERLRERGASEELIEDTEEAEKLPGWLRESGYPHEEVDTSELSLSEVAERIAGWVEGRKI